MKSKTIFMETTEIITEKTVQEIQSVLGRYGASGIQLEYEGGEVKAVAFGVHVGERRLFFALPCRWKPIHTILRNRYKNTPSNEQGERLIRQAKRVAWRQVLRWVEAQLALVHTEMVRIEEVFMPYLVVGKNGQTLFQKLEQSKFMLEEPKS